METCPNPPFRWPTIKRAVFTRKTPNLPDIIRLPARMKKGMASIGKLCVGV